MLPFPAPYRNCAGASVLFLRPRSWRQDRISQVPGQPLREHALLFDPGGPDASGHCDTSDVAFRAVDDVGSAIGHISRLNHTACSLAVYASRLGLLRSHHARLASRWRPTLAGQDSNLLDCFRRFLSVMSLHITSIPLRQASPGAPTAVTPSRWRAGSSSAAGPRPGRASFTPKLGGPAVTCARGVCTHAFQSDDGGERWHSVLRLSFSL